MHRRPSTALGTSECLCHPRECLCHVHRKMLSEIPIRRRRTDGPKFGSGPDELETNGGEAGIGRAERGNRRFTFVPGLWIHQHYLLPERDTMFQHDEAAVRADGESEGFFAKGTVVFNSAANDEGNVQDQPLAAPESRRGCAIFGSGDFGLLRL